MKAMLAAFAAMAVITVGSSFALNNAGFSSQEQGTTSSGAVRLD